jgi:hypothetical protein
LLLIYLKFLLINPVSITNFGVSVDISEYLLRHKKIVPDRHYMVEWITEPFIFSTFFVGEIVLTPYYESIKIYERAETRMNGFNRKN